ncbi:MAG TPA: pilus assembly protein TadG-related protein [Pyrinomonadaceae bacterium]|nr:pilus assembly protein TadG-related protein [Pyrinomonadaceae bacterium]
MKTRNHSRALRRKNERGNVLAYTVISALFLFFAVGLGVDLSHFYLAKTELQNAADAAALAGASALTPHDAASITTAVDRAVSIMNLNKYNFNNKNFAATMDTTAQRSLVTFAINLDQTWYTEAQATASSGIYSKVRFVKVFTPSVGISVFFASPILGSSKNLSANATAGLSVPGNVRFCMAPLSAVAPDPPPGGTGTFPAWAQGSCPTAGIQADGCDPTKQFCKGCKYTIRYEGGSGPSAGNYNILACAGSGASDVRDALATYGESCKCGNVSPGDTITTKPGVAAGPVAQGLNVRFDQYGAGLSYGTTMPPDSNVAQGASHGHGSNTTWDGISWSDYGQNSPFEQPANGHTGIKNRRVLIIPIIAASQYGNGRTQVQIGSLGGFFMNSQAIGSSSDVQVEYIGGDIVGVVGFDPNGTNSTNVVTPVLYR